MKKLSHFPKPKVLPVGPLVVHFPSLTMLLSVFARALPLSRSPQLSFILRINFYDVYSKASYAKLAIVPSRSVGFRTHLQLAIVTGGFCTCSAIVLVSAVVFHLRTCNTLPPGAGRACKANDQRSAQRSVRSVGISDRSVEDLRLTGRN